MNWQRPTGAASPAAHKMGPQDERRNDCNGRMTMLHNATCQAVRCLARAFAACALVFAGAAWAQSGEPIKIGTGISQTGGLAPNGKSALLAQRFGKKTSTPRAGS